MQPFYKKHQKTIQFIMKTVIYFVVIMALIYLYAYRNVQGGGFIYNEF